MQSFFDGLGPGERRLLLGVAAVALLAVTGGAAFAVATGGFAVTTPYMTIVAGRVGMIAAGSAVGGRLLGG
jgi:hypothetical protein